MSGQQADRANYKVTILPDAGPEVMLRAKAARQAKRRSQQ